MAKHNIIERRYAVKSGIPPTTYRSRGFLPYGVGEIIFHGGDINTQEIINELKEIATLYIVRGNNDKDWAENIPETINETVFGFSFFLCHKMSDIKKSGIPENTDFVIYGHSHKYETYEDNGIFYINPGSPGPRRFHQPVTMAVLTVDDADRSYEIEFGCIA